MHVAYVFPGQGSQEVGMGKALNDAHAVARDVFEEVNEALGEDLTSILWEGPLETLTLTRNAQPALMAAGVAAYRVLREATDDQTFAPFCMAGHSLGEYSALAAAGCFSAGDAAKLLRIRGDAMQNAVPVGEGAMAAIIGMELDAVLEVLRNEDLMGVCDCANDNAPGQVVVSGDKAAVDTVIALASDNSAKRCIPLAVSAPFHCRLMQPAADAMREALETVPFGAPSVPIFQNVTAGPVTDPQRIKENLVTQVTQTVRWRESVAAMVDAGASQFVECGPGKVLAGLIKRISRGTPTAGMAVPDDMAAIIGAK